jgi:hypothetical protein
MNPIGRFSIVGCPFWIGFSAFGLDSAKNVAILRRMHDRRASRGENGRKGIPSLAGIARLSVFGFTLFIGHRLQVCRGCHACCCSQATVGRPYRAWGVLTPGFSQAGFSAQRGMNAA